MLTKPAYRLKAFQTIEVDIPPPRETTSLPEPVSLHILYEDDDLIVINKPAGMVVHPAAGNERGTLVNALLYHCKNLSGIGGIIRPGIVHRLDKGTSGVLVAAKRDSAHISLVKQFQHHSILREYVGLVVGQFDTSTGFVERPIGRHPIERKKMSTKSPRCKPAVTHWKEEKRFSYFTLMRFSLKTGRTHQIRVHMADSGHPIVGDTTYGRQREWYGSRGLEAEMRAIKAILHRSFLHAERLGFTHPATNEFMMFSVPLPHELVAVLEILT
jgi:23S rRNA pseudouridine1911/1915/1917 synthase